MNIVEKIMEKIKEVFHRTPKKIKKGVAIGVLATAATVGLANCGTEKDAQDANNTKVEQENNFKDQIKYDVEKETNQAVEQSNVEKASQLKTTEEVKEFLKDLYIEQYEKETGDTTRTTEDIEFKNKTNQDYVYVNQQTGEIITHGETPDQVKQKLNNDGISYDIKHDVDIYRVMDKEGKELDGIILQSKDEETVPIKVILGDQYDDKQYTSILAEMGTVIPDGLAYADYLEKGNKDDIAVSRAQFIKSVEKFESAIIQKLQVGDVLKDERIEGKEGFEPAE